MNVCVCSLIDVKIDTKKCFYWNHIWTHGINETNLSIDIVHHLTTRCNEIFTQFLCTISIYNFCAERTMLSIWMAALNLTIDIFKTGDNDVNFRVHHVSTNRMWLQDLYRREKHKNDVHFHRIMNLFSMKVDRNSRRMSNNHNVFSVYMVLLFIGDELHFGNWIHLPFNMWTRTEIGFAFEGAHVYIPLSLWMAFCTSRRLVVRRPFSVTSDIPPRGESKFITYWRWKKGKQKHEHEKNNQQNDRNDRNIESTL